jgi:hypothetical protein
MVRLILFFCFVSLSMAGMSQTTPEINPNIDKEWRFVRGGEVALPNGIAYSFEVPAEVGFDYMFTLRNQLDTMDIQVTVTDLQGDVVKAVAQESVNGTFTMVFGVNDKATYRVIIGVVDQSKPGGTNLPTEMYLVRKVHY